MNSDPNCIFCKIVSGEIPSKEIYSDEKVMAVLDINPAAKGHVLLFPKNHYPIMPVIPPDDFKYMCKASVLLSKTIRTAMLSEKNMIFIANGSIAGQQSMHFLLHIIPNNNMQCFEMHYNSKSTEEYTMLKNNISIMMQNHYKREGKQTIIKDTQHIFETENFLLKIPEKRAVKGHLAIESKQELFGEELEEFFYAASYSATAVFEGLGAHGTNIMINESEKKLKGDILPRFSEDGLNFFWTPLQLDQNIMEGIRKSIAQRCIGIDVNYAPPLKKTTQVNINSLKSRIFN